MEGGEKKIYETEQCGTLNTPDYRLYFTDERGFISPWHDIPLFADEKQKIYNMVLEIPRWSNAKMEMNTHEPLSPIMQDKSEDNVVRFVENIFPYHGFIWNYGALPQTWEDPEKAEDHTGGAGDDDPIDVIEIGSNRHRRGDIIRVKLIGALALLSKGETDWKLITIDVDDPLANQVNTIEDVEQHFDGLLEATKHWFSIYQIPSGNPPNEIAFNGQIKDQAFAHKVVQEAHQAWKSLVEIKNPKLNTLCRLPNAAFPLTEKECEKIVKEHDGDTIEEVACNGQLDQYCYLKN
uniref:inorganic diphosphatase n=1 Tax=Ditylenchus dipsaci TaxID=166011 RepID=A0A915DTB8_9BILA